MSSTGTEPKKLVSLLLNKDSIIKENEQDITEKKAVFNKCKNELRKIIHGILNDNNNNRDYITVEIANNQITVGGISSDLTITKINELIELLGMDSYIINPYCDRVFRKCKLEINFYNDKDLEVLK
jgi:hypothetical protein